MGAIKPCARFSPSRPPGPPPPFRPAVQLGVPSRAASRSERGASAERHWGPCSPRSRGPPPARNLESLLGASQEPLLNLARACRDSLVLLGGLSAASQEAFKMVSTEFGGPSGKCHGGVPEACQEPRKRLSGASREPRRSLPGPRRCLSGPFFRCLSGTSGAPLMTV